VVITGVAIALILSCRAGAGIPAGPADYRPLSDTTDANDNPKALDPNPPDGALGVITPLLAWRAGATAVWYNVYLGTDPNLGPMEFLYTWPPANPWFIRELEPGRTYYWRVDSIEADGVTVHQGDVWRFTMLSLNPGVMARYFEGVWWGGQPVVTRVEDSIDHNWGAGEVVAGLSDDVSARWTANFEVPVTGTYVLTTMSNDSAWLWLNGSALNDDCFSYYASDVPIEIHLEAGDLYALRMEWRHSKGDALAQLWWEGPLIPRQIIPGGPLQLPLKAAGPCPPHNAVDVPQSLVLTWYAGEAATHHDIYFGQDPNAVANATTGTADIYRGRHTRYGTAFAPGLLDWDRMYYWRIDEVNDAHPESAWKGNVWRFTTADFLVVDDFESYSSTSIYEIWIDSWSWRSGSSVVPEPSGPCVERTIVHSGRQSMPFDYNNVRSPWYTEVYREFSPIQNWLIDGVDTLVLYVRGLAANAPVPLFVAVQDSAGKVAVAVHPDPQVALTTEWVEWKIPLSSLPSVNPTKIKRLSIGAGNWANPSPGGAGRIYIDDIRVIKPTSTRSGAAGP
jgi:hypothetical protein